MGVYRKYDLRKVINASGTMTSLGASSVSREVIESMREILPLFVEMKDLQRKASEVIVKATGAEAGFVTACAASGITLTVAACMTGENLGKVEQLPDTTGMKNEVIIQKGHAVNFGASVTQTIRLSGAKVIEIGNVTGTGTYQLESTINENTASAMYVVSHHTLQYGCIPLPLFIKTTHKYNIPVIVDAAAEYNLRGFIATGADIVIYSGHKFLGGPTSGLVAGRKDLIRSCYFQEIGIGRTMKVGKEGIVGLIAALEGWEKKDHKKIREIEEERAKRIINKLEKIKGLGVSPEPDPTGNPVTRVKVKINPNSAGLSAFELSRELSKGEPAIKVRNHHVDEGFFYLDVCNILEEEDIDVICNKIIEILSKSDEEKKEIKKKYLYSPNLADLEIMERKNWLKPDFRQ